MNFPFCKRREPGYMRRDGTLIIQALLFILVATSLLRVSIIVNKTTLEYDEAISYLAATCNQTSFDNASFAPLPRPAAEWKQYLSLTNPFCFDQIRDGLVHSDVHPPLYFWVLHLWVMAFGVHLWTGTTLNMLIAIFATFALFMLAKNMLQNGYEALLVVASYALNPSVVLISKEARQYDLLILFLILAVWFTHILIKNPSIWQRAAILLMLALAAGSLTHYLFLLLVPTACFVYAVWQMADRRRAWQMAIPILGGYGLAWALNPDFWVNINRQAERTMTPTWFEFVMRFERVLVAFATFYYVLLPLLLLLLVALYLAWREQGKGQRFLRQINIQGWQVFFFLVWFGGVVIGMYLAFLTPVHTIGSSKYLSMVWPFLAFTPVFALRLVHYRRSALLYLGIIPVLWILIFPSQMFLLRLPAPTPPLVEAEMILLDNPARGLLFPFVWHVPDETLMIAAYQKQLLAQPAGWLTYLPDRTVYVNVNEVPNTAEQGEDLLALLAEQGYKVEGAAQKIVTITTAYTVYSIHGP